MATRQVAKCFLFIIVIHLFIIFTEIIMHPVYPPEILHNLCFQFFLDAFIRVVPRVVNKVHYGVSENGALFKP